MERIDEPLDRVLPRRLTDLFPALFGHRSDGGLDQIAHHRLDIAPDVADLGVFGCLDFHERRADESGQASRDFGFADAGRADHQNVLRRDLVAQIFSRTGAAVAIAQCDGDGAFRLRLPHDVLVEFGDDLTRRQRA